MKESILGITVLYSNYLDAHLNVLKVNGVQRDGPAYIAGLTSQSDFVVGAFKEKDLVFFESISDFADLISDYESRRKTVIMFVYNT